MVRNSSCMLLSISARNKGFKVHFIVEMRKRPNMSNIILETIPKPSYTIYKPIINHKKPNNYSAPKNAQRKQNIGCLFATVSPLMGTVVGRFPTSPFLDWISFRMSALGLIQLPPNVGI